MNNLDELCENQSKLLIDRINQTEKNFSNLVESLTCLNRKQSRARNKEDEIAKTFRNISENQSTNDTLNSLIENLSISFTHLADVSTSRNIRIEEKVINELFQYVQYICKNAKEEVKNLLSARDREITKRKNLEMNKRSRKQGTSENEIMLSNMQISKILKEITAVAENFEKQKIADMKEILMNLILIQLKYFSSGLEIFSNAYESIKDIDEKSDLEQFVMDVKKINRQFKKNFEQENRMENKFFSFSKAFSMFSHSTSNLDRIEKRDKKSSKRTMNKSQSEMSLNSLDSDLQEIRKESRPINLEVKTNEISDVETEESDSSIEETTSEDIPVNQTTSRVKHEK